jgi:hypothetical protein
VVAQEQSSPISPSAIIVPGRSRSLLVDISEFLFCACQMSNNMPYLPKAF